MSGVAAAVATLAAGVAFLGFLAALGGLAVFAFSKPDGRANWHAESVLTYGFAALVFGGLIMGGSVLFMGAQG